MMRSITAKAQWGGDSKRLWCSRNIHVSGALQNPADPPAFEKRQMNNPKGGREIQWKRSFGLKKKRSKAAFALVGLWSPSSSRHWYTHTQRHTGWLSLPLFSLCLSLSVFFLFHLFHIPLSLPLVSSRDPRVPQYLPLALCPGFDICSRGDQRHTLDPFLQLPRL